MVDLATAELTQSLKAAAQAAGFSWAGVAPAVSPPGFSRLEEWWNAGWGGELDYIGERLDAYADPGKVLERARSILMLGMNYSSLPPPAAVLPGHGRISRYAWGAGDYHELIWQRLDQLVIKVKQLFEGSSARGVVDTAPLMEREFARLAGLGWQGKNTLILSPQSGSWFFLAAVLVDVELAYDQPFTADHCGTCTACLDACPTQAFVQPRVLDASRCISYLTIELKGAIPRDLRGSIGDWVFGCDVCQEVCPWNRFATPSEEETFHPLEDGMPDLRDWFFWTDEQFRARFRGTALWRPRRRGLLRNAAVVLGNQRQADSVPALARGLADSEALVRGASAWALGQIGGDLAREQLLARLAAEPDPEVLEEIRFALGI